MKNNFNFQEKNSLWPVPEEFYYFYKFGTLKEDNNMDKDLDKKKQLLRDEIDKLNHEYKVELPKKIAEARAYGDLKENAEYHAARERQSFVKARISQLSVQLSQLNDLKIDNIANDRVAYGAKVTVVDLDSEDKIEFTFVSSNEVNPAEGKISLSSPIGGALNNRIAGDKVEVTIPAGKSKYYIEKIITIPGNELKKKYKK